MLIPITVPFSGLHRIRRVIRRGRTILVAGRMSRGRLARDNSCGIILPLCHIPEYKAPEYNSECDSE